MSQRNRAAFTLVELLVVIGIIVLIVGFTLPMVLKAFRAGDRTRTAADLNTIAIALDAYKNDFGEYPRVEVPGTGFAVLGKALVAPFGDTLLPGGGPDTNDPENYSATKAYKPGDCVSSGISGGDPRDRVAVVASTGASISDNKLWAKLDCNDGFDGAGFRLRFDVVTKSGGKSFGPYLPPGKMKMDGLCILDHNGNPILYFPQSPVKININPTTLAANRGYYISSFGTPAGDSVVTGPSPTVPMYNFDDNGYLATATSSDPASGNTCLAKMQAMLGLRTSANMAAAGAANGYLADGESPASTNAYLLWSAGPDAIFGPVDDVVGQDKSTIDRLVRKCDDVTNFK